MIEGLGLALMVSVVHAGLVLDTELLTNPGVSVRHKSMVFVVHAGLVLDTNLLTNSGASVRQKSPPSQKR